MRSGTGNESELLNKQLSKDRQDTELREAFEKSTKSFLGFPGVLIGKLAGLLQPRLYPHFDCLRSSCLGVPEEELP